MLAGFGRQRLGDRDRLGEPDDDDAERARHHVDHVVDADAGPGHEREAARDISDDLHAMVRQVGDPRNDQADHHDVGLRRADDHAEQDRFADARAGHDADALALADGEQAVDRAHAHIHRFEHAAAIERAREACTETDRPSNYAAVAPASPGLPPPVPRKAAPAARSLLRRGMKRGANPTPPACGRGWGWAHPAATRTLRGQVSLPLSQAGGDK